VRYAPLFLVNLFLANLKWWVRSAKTHWIQKKFIYPNISGAYLSWIQAKATSTWSC